MSSLSVSADTLCCFAAAIVPDLVMRGATDFSCAAPSVTPLVRGFGIIPDWFVWCTGGGNCREGRWSEDCYVILPLIINHYQIAGEQNAAMVVVAKKGSPFSGGTSTVL
jgi:hypothetical protein